MTVERHPGPARAVFPKLVEPDGKRTGEFRRTHRSGGDHRLEQADSA